MSQRKRQQYLCEVAATLVAICAFVAVYLIAYSRFGAQVTLLAAWLPAALLAWLTARSVGAALRRMFDLDPPRAAVPYPVDADDYEVEPLRASPRPRQEIRTR